MNEKKTVADVDVTQILELSENFKAYDTNASTSNYKCDETNVLKVSAKKKVSEKNVASVEKSHMEMLELKITDTGERKVHEWTQQ